MFIQFVVDFTQDTVKSSRNRKKKHSFTLHNKFFFWVIWVLIKGHPETFPKKIVGSNSCFSAGKQEPRIKSDNDDKETCVQRL